MLSRRTSILMALLTGVALEVLVSAASGRREAWDSSLYWTVGVPAALVMAVLIGFLSRDNDWLWTLLVVPGQFVAMAFKTQEFGLLPLGLILGTVLSAPFLGAAFVGARMRRRS